MSDVRAAIEQSEALHFAKTHRPNYVTTAGGTEYEQTRVKCDGNDCDFFFQHRSWFTALDKHSAHVADALVAVVEQAQADERERIADAKDDEIRGLADKWQRSSDPNRAAVEQALMGFGHFPYDVLVADLLAVVVQAQADAFDEGVKAAGGYGHEDDWSHDFTPFDDNPYRADALTPTKETT